MTPAVILRQVLLEDHDLAPDASSAVVAARRVRGNRYVSTLDVVDLSAPRRGRLRPLTEGLVRDGQPRISPDGRTVAFVRSDPADPERPTRLGLVPLAGGQVRNVRAGDHGGITEIAWSPDGRRIAFTAEVDPPRFLVGRTPPPGGSRRRGRRQDEDAPLARRITRIDWRYDGVGHVDRWSHLFVVDVARGADPPRQVTRGDWGVAEIAWHPDGRTVAFAADLATDADLRPKATIHAVDVDAVEPAPREVLALGGPAERPAFSPDGRWLAAVGVLDPEPLDDLSPGVVVAPADGSAGPVALAPELDRPAGAYVDTDLMPWRNDGRPGPVWLDDRSILAVVTDRGRAGPLRFAFDPATGRAAGSPSSHAPSEAVVWSVAVARNGTVAALGTRDGQATELMTLDVSARDPAWRTRTRHGSAWQRRHPQPHRQSIMVPGAGGPIETWVASPPGAGHGPLPTVVDLHGGPLGSWSPAPMLEVMLLTARGYRVVLPNIRGSASYGRDWIRPQLGDWGGVDAADVHAVIDHVVEGGLADPRRLGILGLSYGGFLVHWLISTSDRFAAAVSENGVANQVSAWANSDTGPEYSRSALLGDTLTPEGVAKLWRQSPLARVAAIRTPLLMLQGEADLRCVPQDNEQLFVALRSLGRTVEYVLYPEQSHIYAVVGRPDRRIDRMTRMLDWFDRHLA